VRKKERRTLQWQLVNLIDCCITVGVSKTRAAKVGWCCSQQLP
jgi:hypothetical protein